jgi:hypothetical protein
VIAGRFPEIQREWSVRAVGPKKENTGKRMRDNETMRTSPVLGRKAWFGPRRLGWGLEPVSPEGWMVTFAFAALALGLRRMKLNSRWVRWAVLGGFLIVALLTGSAPGGAVARGDFDAARAAARVEEQAEGSTGT